MFNNYYISYCKYKNCFSLLWFENQILLLSITLNKKIILTILRKLKQQNEL